MVAVNELTQQKCTSRTVLQALPVLIAPFAPHIAEELWEQTLSDSPLKGEDTGREVPLRAGSVCDAQWPQYEEKYLVETSVKLGVQFNGKVRFDMLFPADATPEQMIALATAAPEAAKYLEGMQVVKTIAIPGRIVNIVLKPQA